MTLAVAVTVSLSPMLAAAACHVETLELPVAIVNARALVTVAIDGAPATLVVDSGSSQNMLTAGAATQFGLYANPHAALHVQTVSDSIPTLVTTVERLTLARQEFKRVDFVIGGNEPRSGAVGFLGRSILSRADTEYDLAHGAIRLMFPNDECAHGDMAYWAGATPVVEVDLLSHAHERFPSAIRAHASLNGKDVLVLLDTGSTTTVVSALAARRAGVTDADQQAAGMVSGAGAKRLPSWVAPFAKFELGDETMLRNRLRVVDMDIDGADMLLGIDFFLAHRIYVSRQQSKMFFTYNGGPVFADRPVVPRAKHPMRRSRPMRRLLDEASRFEPGRMQRRRSTSFDRARGPAHAARSRIDRRRVASSGHQKAKIARREVGQVREHTREFSRRHAHPFRERRAVLIDRGRG